MRRQERSPPPVVPGADAHRHLAARVIDQALRDLENPLGSATDRESAREFLRGSAMLHFWCALADVDACCLIARASVLMVRGRRPAPYGGRRPERTAGPEPAASAANGAIRSSGLSIGSAGRAADRIR